MTENAAPAVSGGPADIAPVAALLAEPARARLLTALVDGRALPASVLAAEAGVTPQTASGHLARLLDGGLLTVERSGRHRYYRLASPEVSRAIEAVAAISPARPIRSLRDGTRAKAMRQARLCYDHLAGRLGVEVAAALVGGGVLEPVDGEGTERRAWDRLAAPVAGEPYRLRPPAGELLRAWGVDLDAVRAARGRRPLLLACVDWSEQRHHLAGRLGAAVAGAALRAGWCERRDGRRDLRVTEEGRRRLGALGVRLDA